jgi:hypothetical protein
VWFAVPLSYRVDRCMGRRGGERRVKGRREGERRERARIEEEYVNDRKSRSRSVEKEKWGEEG